MAKNTRDGAVLSTAHELKLELASRVARLIGSAEKQATAIPRLTLQQRTAPTGACHVTYEPSVIVIAQGSPISIIRQTHAQHLDGNFAIEARIACAIHFPHTPGADQREDLVRTQSS